jgi:hypothetical protein
MCISYDNNYLFTSSKDGSVLISEIKDKDPRGGLIKSRQERPMIPTFSDEILCEKSEILDLAAKRDSLK